MIAKYRDIRRFLHHTGQYLCSLVVLTQTVVDPAQGVQQGRLVGSRQLDGQFLCLVEAGFIGAVVGQQGSQIVGSNDVLRILHQEALIGSNSRIILLLTLLDCCQPKHKAGLIR